MDTSNDELLIWIREMHIDESTSVTENRILDKSASCMLSLSKANRAQQEKENRGKNSHSCRKYLKTSSLFQVNTMNARTKFQTEFDKILQSENEEDLDKFC